VNKGREGAFLVALLLGLPVFGIWFAAVLGPALVLGAIALLFFVLLGHGMDKDAAALRDKDTNLK